MGLRKLKPVTPGQRGTIMPDFSELTKSSPERSLLRPYKKTAGRNNQGRITVRRKGGGHKRRYRVVDFKRRKDGVPAKVAAVEYDPNRTCRIALLHYTDGEKRYILAPHKIKVGDMVESGDKVEQRIGNCMPLRNIALGSEVHNVELQKGRGGQMVRSAGAAAIVQAKESNTCLLTLPSGEMRKVHIDCRATVGRIGFPEHTNRVIGKAGRNRWLGKRPKVRGSCMNPHDHPMGGGEGRRSGGRDPVSPTGVLAKGGKTRKKRKPSSRFIVRRRKTKRHK